LTLGLSDTSYVAMATVPRWQETLVDVCGWGFGYVGAQGS
jgi:hypothetical protein